MVLPAPGLSDEQLDFFHREGYLVLPELVPKSVTDSLEAEIDAFLETKGDEEMAAGRLSSAEIRTTIASPTKYSRYPTSSRYTRIFLGDGSHITGKPWNCLLTVWTE